MACPGQGNKCTCTQSTYVTNDVNKYLKRGHRLITHHTIIPLHSPFLLTIFIITTTTTSPIAHSIHSHKVSSRHIFHRSVVMVLPSKFKTKPSSHQLSCTLRFSSSCVASVTVAHKTNIYLSIVILCVCLCDFFFKLSPQFFSF